MSQYEIKKFHLLNGTS